MQMSLVVCPECRKEIAAQPATCPFCGTPTIPSEGAEIKLHVPSLVLSIVGLVFSLLLPIITFVCSIVGLVMANNNRETHKTKAAYIMCIIGLIIAVINSAFGAYLGATGRLF